MPMRPLLDGWGPPVRPGAARAQLQGGETRSVAPHLASRAVTLWRVRPSTSGYLSRFTLSKSFEYTADVSLLGHGFDTGLLLQPRTVIAQCSDILRPSLGLLLSDHYEATFSPIWKDERSLHQPVGKPHWIRPRLHIGCPRHLHRKDIAHIKIRPQKDVQPCVLEFLGDSQLRAARAGHRHAQFPVQPQNTLGCR